MKKKPKAHFWREDGHTTYCGLTGEQVQEWPKTDLELHRFEPCWPCNDALEASADSNSGDA